MTVAAGLMVLGSVLFLAAAFGGVPRVYTEPDPEVRLRLLTESPAVWRVAQLGFGLGALLVAAGIGVLAAASGGTARAVIAAACGVLLVGALTWAWDLYRRAVGLEDFAYRRMPGWRFATYTLLTVGGLALLGGGLLAGAYPGWLGWLSLAGAAGLLAAYLWLRDLPPLLFYMLFLVVGVVLW